MNIKHICFDLDGVLINSLEIMESSWLEAAQKYKLDINFNSYKNYSCCFTDYLIYKFKK